MGGRIDEGRVAAWRERFRRHDQSGLSILRFCAQEGVSVPTLYAWRKRLGESPRNSPAERPTNFATVRLVGGAPLVAWCQWALKRYQREALQKIPVGLPRRALILWVACRRQAPRGASAWRTDWQWIRHRQ